MAFLMPGLILEPKPGVVKSVLTDGCIENFEFGANEIADVKASVKPVIIFGAKPGVMKSVVTAFVDNMNYPTLESETTVEGEHGNKPYPIFSGFTLVKGKHKKIKKK